VGSGLKCRPRTVPIVAEKEWLSLHELRIDPGGCQQVLAEDPEKKPRASPRRSGMTSFTSGISVSIILMPLGRD
jgi:hypothetical protein